MEKTSKVVSVQGRGTYESSYGVDLENGVKGFYKFEIAMENGDVAQYSGKEKDQKKFVIGQETTYDYTGGEYPKIKPVQQQQQRGGYQKDPVFEKKRQIMIVLQSSLKEANVYHHANGYQEMGIEDFSDAGPLSKLEETCQTMEFFAERILKNKYLQS